MKVLRRLIKLICVLVLLFVVYGELATRHFLRVAFQPDDKISYETNLKGLGFSSVNEIVGRYNMEDQYLTLEDSLTLHAYFIRHAVPSAKTALLLHGYKDNVFSMMLYADMYLALGYNVLLPDMRAHGRSEGAFVGFGWLDRRDVLQWTHRAIALTGGDSAKIVMHGISMGAASVMMAAGDSLPVQVKACIEDCGYTSVYDEFFFQIHHIKPHSYALFKKYILKRASQQAGRRFGVRFEEASALEQVQKATVPMLFIHGDADDFVPYGMVQQLYLAKTKGPRQLLTVHGAGHAHSIHTDSALYVRTCAKFLKQYIASGQSDLLEINSPSKSN